MFVEMGAWYSILDGDPRGRRMYDRHYSSVNYRHKRPKLFAGPGEKMVLMTSDSRALFVWRKFDDLSGQHGINCAIFRNEAPELYLSSDLIREAVRLAARRWPARRFYTYVNARKVRSSNPGYCFKAAGWRECGVTASRRLIILEYDPLRWSLMAQGAGL